MHKNVKAVGFNFCGLYILASKAATTRSAFLRPSLMPLFIIVIYTTVLHGSQASELRKCLSKRSISVQSV